MKITIIIPLFNCESYIKKTIDSVLKQTHADIELIIVNDGSTDKSEEICKAMAKIDGRIKYIYQKNQGVSVARNTGLSHATGEYVTFVDSDDWIDNDLIERLVKKGDGADIVVTKECYLAYSDGFYKTYPLVYLPTGKNKKYSSPIAFLTESVLGRSVGGGPVSTLFKKRIIDTFAIRFIVGQSWSEDRCFLVDFLLKAETISICNVCGYHYFQRHGSLTRSFTSNNMEMHISADVYMWNRLQEAEEIDALRALNSNFAWGMVVNLLSICDKRNKQKTQEKITQIRQVFKTESFQRAFGGSKLNLPYGGSMGFRIFSKIMISVAKLRNPYLLYFIAKTGLLIQRF